MSLRCVINHEGNKKTDALASISLDAISTMVSSRVFEWNFAEIQVPVNTCGESNTK